MRRILLFAMLIFFVCVGARAQGISIGVGSPETVMTASQRISAGLNTWPDGSIGFFLYGGTNYVFAAGGATNSQGLTSIDLNSLATNFSLITTTTQIPLGGPGAFDQNYAGVGQVYYDAADGILIGMYHAEYWYDPPNPLPIYAGLGLAVSPDLGVTWKKLGQVISPQTARSGNCQADIGSGTLVARPDGYFYTYYDDTAAGCTGFHLALARAQISDVVAAAVAGALPAGNLWFKYFNGTFTEPGVTDRSNPALGGGAFTPVFDSQAWFANVAWDSAVGQYVMAYAAGWTGIAIRFSGDGITWSPPTQVVSGGTIPSGGNAIYYPEVVNTSGGDPNTLGSSFYLYWVSPFGVNWDLTNLNRAQLTLTAFAPEACGIGTYPFPYADVSGVGGAFCPGIMEAYVTGVSKGTSPTTFSPNETVSRVQMTTFLQRSLDQGLTRASRRAAFKRWWTPQNTNAMQTITVGTDSQYCAADGYAIWTPSIAGGQLVEVQASTGAVLGTWTGATSGQSVLVAAGKVYVAGQTSPGNLYVIDPTQAPGPVTTAASTLGSQPHGIAFDGINVWTANIGPPGSVSIITPQSPFAVTTVTTGFTAPYGILYDGGHIWVTDFTAGTLLKLDPSGNILQTVLVGSGPSFPVFDGANIWVPNEGDSSITIVQASTGDVVATISADESNLLNNPRGATFDGQRVLVTNVGGNSVTLFKAADLSFIANVSTGASTSPYGACSDGINFWIPLADTAHLLRF